MNLEAKSGQEHDGQRDQDHGSDHFQPDFRGEFQYQAAEYNTYNTTG